MRSNSSILVASSARRCYGRPQLDLGDMGRPSKELFVENLNRRLRELKITGSELARRVDVAPITVKRWRDGQREPSFEDLDAIAGALGFETTYELLYEQPDDSADQQAIREARERAEQAVKDLEASLKRSRKGRH